MTPEEAAPAQTPHGYDWERVRLKALPPIRYVTPHAAAIAIFMAVLAVFFWRLTIEHQVLSPADWIYVGHPWAADPPEGYTGPKNANQGDDAFIGYPRRWAYYNGDGASSWQDDYLAGGRSTFSVDHLGLDLYPPAWVYRVLPFPIANGFFHAGVLLVAGVSMHLLLVQLRFPWLAAVYGGILFMLNGHFIVWLGAFSLPAILGLIPLMLFGFERFRETRAPPYLVIPAACFALQLYIAYVPGWIVTGGVLAIYGGVRLAPDVWRRDLRWVAVDSSAYVGAAFAGVLLGAYSLLPSLAIAADSSYQQDRAFGLHRAGAENAWTYLFPDYWGTEGAAAGGYLAPYGEYPSLITYFAISAVPLAVVGLWATRRSWIAWFSLGVLAFSLSQIYGIPPLSEIAHLPGFKQTAAFRWNLGLPLVVSILAPAGLGALLRDDPGESRPRLALIATGVVATGVLSALVLIVLRPDAATMRLITEGQGLIPSFAQIDDHVRTGSTHYHRQVGLLAVAGVVVAFALIRTKWRAPAAFGLVALATVDLVAFGAGYSATIEREDLYPESPGLEFLQADDDLFRIAQVWDRLDPLPAYTANVYGLDTINGYDHFRDDDYSDFLSPQRSPEDESYFNGVGYVTFGSNRWALNQNLISLLNAKYIVTPPNGLYFATARQSRNDIAYAIYGGILQGQTFTVDDDSNAIEFLMGVGDTGRPTGDALFRLYSGFGGPSVYEWRVDIDDIRNNRWLTLPLPEDLELAAGGAYVEIEAEEATVDHPLWVWGIRSDDLPDWQRYEEGERVDGALTLRALENPGSWVTRVYEGEDLFVYRVNTVLPRAWGVGGVQFEDSNADAIIAAGMSSFDPAREVILVGGDERDVTAPAGGYETEIDAYSTDQMDVTVNFADPGHLVVSTRYDPAWRAEVDGHEVDVTRADGILMAIPVDEGRHAVTISFEPGEYKWGKRISIVTLVAVCAALAGYALYTRRRLSDL